MQFKQGRFGAVIVGILFASGCASKATFPTVYSKDSVFENKAKMVMLVSFDGLRPDAIEAAGADHILSLSSAGVRAKSAHTIVPSITLPSHSSMVSGVGPDKHQILWNHWVPSYGTISVTTMFEEVKKNGLKTAMVANKEKFQHLNRPGSIDRVVLEYGSPLEVAAKVGEVIKTDQPQLLFVHFGHPDKAGHEDGWMSKEQLDVIDEADQALGYIFHVLKNQNLLASTAVILTADHGGSGKGHGDASEVSTSIPWIAAGAGIPVKGELAKPIMTYDSAATAVKLLGTDVPASWDGKSVFE